MAATSYVDFTLRWDEQGRPYWLKTDGGKHYLPPITVGQYRDDPRAMEWAAQQGVTAENPKGNIPSNDFFTNPKWNRDTGEYEKTLDWGPIGSIAAGSLIAAPFVAPSFTSGAGAGAGAEAGVLPSSAIPGSHLAVPGAITSQGVSAGVPIASGSLSTLAGGAIPGMTEAGMAGAPTIASHGASALAPAGGGMAFDPFTAALFGGSALASLFGAKSQANAAKEAAEIQAQSAREALQVGKDIYTQQRADQMPWLNAGRGAVSTLSRLMGIDSNPAAASPMFASAAPTPAAGYTPSPSAIPTGRTAVPRTGTLSALGAGGMVALRAPTGEVQQVPAQVAEQFLARGAVRA